MSKINFTQTVLPVVQHSQEGPQTPLDKLRSIVVSCTRCPLGHLRKNAVFGEGVSTARLMFIGEAPGANEDETGRPFIGRAGQLLTRTLAEHEINRDEVYITNIVKCRPPGNRDPQPDEIEACSQYLASQVELINPALICTLGRYAAAELLKRPIKITAEHGRWVEFLGKPLLIAMHPSAAMRSKVFFQHFEHDIQTLAERYKSL